MTAGWRITSLGWPSVRIFPKLNHRPLRETHHRLHDVLYPDDSYVELIKIVRIISIEASTRHR